MVASTALLARHRQSRRGVGSPRCSAGARRSATGPPTRAPVAAKRRAGAPRGVRSCEVTLSHWRRHQHWLRHTSHASSASPTPSAARRHDELTVCSSGLPHFSPRNSAALRVRQWERMERSATPSRTSGFSMRCEETQAFLLRRRCSSCSKPSALCFRSLRRGQLAGRLRRARSACRRRAPRARRPS